MTHLVKHRYAADGGYQRGEETRSRIIAVAVELFGERGFEGVSTRDIAAQAGVNAPALPYYFDSKEGLYLACLEQVIANFWAFMGDIVEQAESTLVDHASDTAIIETFCGVTVYHGDARGQPALIQPSINARCSLSVVSSAGHRHSILSSCADRVSGVPTVVTIEK